LIYSRLVCQIISTFIITIKDHIESIKAIESLNIKLSRPLKIIDNLRKTRRGINYYRYKPKKDEADEAITFAKEVFHPIIDASTKFINK